MPLQLRVNIDVPSLEAGIRFYAEVFGLRVTRRLGDAFAELSAGPFIIDLLAKPEGSTPFPAASGSRAYTRHWTPVHIDFCVDALDEPLARALAAGATQQGEVAVRPFGRIVQLADPFGHGLCLIELSTEGYDAVPGLTRS